MAITFDSFEHALAAGFHDIVVGLRSLAAHQAQIQATGQKIEQVTAAVSVFFPPALEALEIERVSMFALAIVCGLVNRFGGADAAAKAHPAIHADLFTQAEQLMAAYPQLVQQALALFPKPA